MAYWRPRLVGLAATEGRAKVDLLLTATQLAEPVMPATGRTLTDANVWAAVVALCRHLGVAPPEYTPAEDAEASSHDSTKLTRMLDELVIPTLLKRRAVAVAREEEDGAEVPRALIVELMRHARGNPFKVQEIVKSMLGQGRLMLVQHADGRGAALVLERVDKQAKDSIWRTIDDDSTGVMTIEDVMRQQLEALPPVAGDVLRLCSVLGMYFEGTLLRRLAKEVNSMHGGVIAAILSEGAKVDRMGTRALVRFGLLEDVLNKAGRYQFHAKRMRELVYGQLTSTQRRVIHACAAVTLRANAERRHVPVPYLELWKHQRAAGDDEGTWETAAAAAREALGGGDHQLATTVLADVLSSSGGMEQPPRQRAEWRRLLGEAYLGLAERELSEHETTEGEGGGGGAVAAPQRDFFGDGVNQLSLAWR